MTRSLNQQETTALSLLRDAYGRGLSDQASQDYVIAVMGRDNALLVRRVWQREFSIAGPM